MEEKSLYMKNIVKGVVISFITTIILFLILAVILANTSISENVINPSIIVLSSISIFLGASSIARKMQKKGIIIGGLIGFIYMILIYIISSILSGDLSLSVYSIIMILASIFMGGIGGILGVNLN